TAPARPKCDDEVFRGAGRARRAEHDDWAAVRDPLAPRRWPDRVGRRAGPGERVEAVARLATLGGKERAVDEAREQQRVALIPLVWGPGGLPKIQNQAAMAWSFARRVADGAIEQAEDIRIGEGVHAHPDHAVGQGIGFERGAVERRPRGQRTRECDARAA